MSQEFEGVYLLSDDAEVYESTPLANAGWYEEGQHGGAFAALVVGHIEDTVPTLTRMEVARMTVEILRVIPLVPLRITTELAREGKRIQTVQAPIYDTDDTLLAMAMVQRLRTADRPVPSDARPPDIAFRLPDEIEEKVGEMWGVGRRGRVMFHRHAIDAREAVGGFDVVGPGTVWLRLTTPIVAGRETTPVQRMVATADFCNGISRALDYNKWVFMNPDLTIHVARYPIGEWVGLSAESTYGDLGRGVATGTLWDTNGWLGRSTQSLYLDHIP